MQNYQAKSDFENILQWMNTFPEKSIRRLTQINSSTSSSSHIVLALSYGLGDRSIRAINKLIIGLMLSRMKAERQGHNRMVQRINEFLESLHACINNITGVTPVKHSTVACRAVVRRARAS